MSRRAFFALIAGQICWRPQAGNTRDGLTDDQIDALLRRIQMRSSYETVAYSTHEVRWVI